MKEKDLTIDPQLADAWAKGGLEPVELGPFDPTIARAFRARLYRERSKMRALQHSDVKIANQATIALRSDDIGKMFLIIYPANLLLAEALAKAGITSTLPPLD